MALTEKQKVLDPALSFEKQSNMDDLEGRVCYGGLDLSSTTDITSFVLVFPPIDEEDKFSILPFFWVPEETLDLRVRRDHVPYDVWERQGYLQTTEGNVVHYGYIEKFIEKLGERFNIREIAFDRWGAVQMVQNLEGMGFTVPLHRLWHWTEPFAVEMTMGIPCITIAGFYSFKQCSANRFSVVPL